MSHRTYARPADHAQRGSDGALKRRCTHNHLKAINTTVERSGLTQLSEQPVGPVATN